MFRFRGGVEDTRLEAKDTKKIQGQGQPFRGQTLSRPRTGMLEAQDTAASVLQKKRSSKSFSGNLQFKGIARIFDWGGLNHKSQNDVIKNLPVFHLTRILQRERASTNIVEKSKYVTLKTFWESQCNSNVSQTGVWGRIPSCWAIFCNFFGKKSYFNAIESHFAHV